MSRIEVIGNATLYLGDCLEVLRGMPDCSVDSIVTDPPYGLSDHKTAEVAACLTAWLAGKPYLPKGTGFMGKTWDAWVPGPEVFRECLRVLKPGGHMLTFAGTRSMDLMSMAIRLAGFELRDSIGYAHDDGGGAPLLAWCYGSGFPKSMNVAKAVDSQLTIGGSSQRQMRRRDMGDEYRPHKSAGTEGYGDGNLRKGADGDRDIAASAELKTSAAQQWEGFGTALKPAWEPILLARKPLEGTVAANVLAHGTGALNIDGCRVGDSGATKRGSQAEYPKNEDGTEDRSGSWARTGHEIVEVNAGRWPANVIHDGSEEVRAAFPNAKGQQGDLKETGRPRPSSGRFGDMAPPRAHAARIETDASAARFFYCAKAGKRDRGEGNNHPTVKPTDLMRYLCRLVTPTGGVVLDPFAGSGSTGKAAVLEGFCFIGIEREAEYIAIARARIDQVQRQLRIVT